MNEHGFHTSPCTQQVQAAFRLRKSVLKQQIGSRSPGPTRGPEAKMNKRNARRREQRDAVLGPILSKAESLFFDPPPPTLPTAAAETFDWNKIPAALNPVAAGVKADNASPNPPPNLDLDRRSTMRRGRGHSSKASRDTSDRSGRETARPWSISAPGAGTWGCWSPSFILNAGWSWWSPTPIAARPPPASPARRTRPFSPARAPRPCSRRRTSAPRPRCAAAAGSRECAGGGGRRDCPEVDPSALAHAGARASRGKRQTRARGGRMARSGEDAARRPIWKRESARARAPAGQDTYVDLRSPHNACMLNDYGFI